LILGSSQTQVAHIFYTRFVEFQIKNQPEKPLNTEFSESTEEAERENEIQLFPITCNLSPTACHANHLSCLAWIEQT